MDNTYMECPVIRSFIDKDDGRPYKAGRVITLSPKRADDLRGKGVVGKIESCRVIKGAGPGAVGALGSIGGLNGLRYLRLWAQLQFYKIDALFSSFLFRGRRF